MEEVNLQSHLAHGRSRPGIFQVTQLSGAIGVKWSQTLILLHPALQLRVYNNPQQQLEKLI